MTEWVLIRERETSILVNYDHNQVAMGQYLNHPHISIMLIFKDHQGSLYRFQNVSLRPADGRTIP